MAEKTASDAPAATPAAPPPDALSPATSALPQEPDLDTDRITRAWRALMAYRSLSLQVFDTQALSFSHLPNAHQAVIPDVPIRLSKAADAVEHNADVLEAVAALTGVSEEFAPESMSDAALQTTVSDFADVVDAILAIAREWSTQGRKERAMLYDPIVAAVREAAEDALSARTTRMRAARVSGGEDVAHTAGAHGSGEKEEALSFTTLVIGASLGRLAWELARLGIAVQGVEKSYLQLFSANSILNGMAGPKNPQHVFPYVHHTGMVANADEQLWKAQFPDVDPKLVENADFSIVAGEFLELYDGEGSWDCVVTCFSLENTHSVISYVRRIARVLKVGGVWVNHGSLEFRYEDSATEPSVEITKEELEFVTARCGMRVLRRESYRCRPPHVVSGMVSEEVDSVFFVAVKL